MAAADDRAADVFEDLTHDGGVLKKVVRVGDPTAAVVRKGSFVSLHYVGTLPDGAVFDSSRESGYPFKFQLGKGKVIKGWDIAVASMMLKERCQIVVRPEYGYGVEGAGDDIPPNATLHFDMELVACADAPPLSAKEEEEKKRAIADQERLEVLKKAREEAAAKKLADKAAKDAEAAARKAAADEKAAAKANKGKGGKKKGK